MIYFESRIVTQGAMEDKLLLVDSIDFFFGNPFEGVFEKAIVYRIEIYF